MQQQEECLIIGDITFASSSAIIHNTLVCTDVRRTGGHCWEVRVGQSSLCSQVLLLPLGVPCKGWECVQHQS